ncbi:MAG: glycoside hydrolase family 3 C-terminal domain-containing protein, partial [Lacunisphaera sp.]|nr:glycoside hydrolase family 3 C-terminal domain-containing protein [Lacunisphaera sp.]
KSAAHRALARPAAVNSIVLLKNNGVLPLAPTIRNLMVVGPGAASVDALLGNYFGLSPQLVTILEGITARAPEGCRLGYSLGCLPDDATTPPSPAAIYECSCADVTLAVLGTLPVYEGEEGDAFASRAAGDRQAIELSESQRHFLARLRANPKPVVLILTGGGAIACPEAHEWCDAILHVWYPGCEGGHAVADVLFGDAEPGGRLPLTVPRATADLPPFEDYAMAGRTYRFATKTPLYPFGYGLGYTTWVLEDLRCLPAKTGPAGSLAVSVLVRNTGTHPGRTVVQFYISSPTGCGGPSVKLFDFATLDLVPGAGTRVAARLPAASWCVHGDDGLPRHTPGVWRIFAALAAPVDRARELGVPDPLLFSVVVN